MPFFVPFNQVRFVVSKNIDIVKYCQEYFGFALPSALWAKRVSEFELNFRCFLYTLYQFFCFDLICVCILICTIYCSTMFAW